jgi:DNA-binding beta-propeller fold protein YncE
MMLLPHRTFGLLFCVPVVIAAAEEVGPVWTSSYDGPSSRYESPAAACTDEKGNLYVAGSTSIADSPGDEEWAVLKYDPTGEELWEYRGAPGNPAAIAVDGEGNVLVAGSSTYPFDIRTVKLDGVGNEVWSVEFDGPLGLGDFPGAMALDPEGNVLILGSQYRDEEDFVEVLKYDRDGRLDWDVQESFGSPRSIAVDPLGDVYVLAGGGTGFVLQKYDRFGGGIWKRTVGGGDPHACHGLGLALDMDGNPLVAAWSLFKYDPLGNLFWQAEIAGCSHSTAIAVADDGVAAVAACLDGDPPELLVAGYDPDGGLLWKAGDVPLDPYPPPVIGMNRDGALFVACSSRTESAQVSSLRKYDPWEGKEVWTATSPRRGDDGPRCLAFDGRGAPYLVLADTTLETGPDILTRKYDGDGNQQWESRYDRPGHASDQLRGISVDGEGNIAVAGWSYAAGRGVDFATVKYGPDGKQLWAARRDPPGARGYLTSLGIDPRGDIVVTGLFGAAWSDDGGNAWTIKYGAGGELLWEAEFLGPGSTASLNLNYGSAMAIDRLGRVTVAVTGGDHQVCMYGADGAPVWTAACSSVPMDAVADEAGNVHILGMRGDLTVIAKFGPGGALLWERTFDGGGFNPRAQQVLVDRAGGVYSVITTDVTADHAVTDIVKHDASGSRLWTARQGVAGEKYFFAPGAALDGDGNLLIAGEISATWYESHDISTVKLDPDGNRLWRATYDGPARGHDAPIGIAVDPAGNAHVGGISAGAGGTIDIIVVTYGPSGEELRVGRARGDGTPDRGGGVAVDPRGDVLLACTWSIPGSRDDFVILKFPGLAPGEPPFIRGDCDGDGKVGGTVTDAIVLLEFSFLGGERPSCLSACDANGDGEVTGEVTDAVYLLRYGFLGGPPPPAPFPGCGPGAGGGPGCEAYPRCGE